MGRTKQQEVYDEFDHLIDLCEKQREKIHAEFLRVMRDNLPPDREDPEAYEIQDPTGDKFPKNKTTDALFNLHEDLNRRNERGELEIDDADELGQIEEELEERLAPSQKGKSLSVQLLGAFVSAFTDNKTVNPKNLEFVALLDISGDANIYALTQKNIEKLKTEEALFVNVKENGKCIISAETITNE